MKQAFTILFLLVGLKIFCQDLNKHEIEFEFLKNSGISGLDSFMINLGREISNKIIIDSITLDGERVISNSFLDTLRISNFPFKQILIQKRIRISHDTVLHYTLYLSTTYREDFIHRPRFSLDKTYVKSFVGNGKLKNRLTPAYDVDIEIPAFSQYSMEVHKLTGKLVKSYMPVLSLEHGLIVTNITNVLMADEVIITRINYYNQEYISFTR